MPEIPTAFLHRFLPFLIVRIHDPIGFVRIPRCPFLWKKFLDRHITVEQLIHRPVGNSKATGSENRPDLISILQYRSLRQKNFFSDTMRKCVRLLNNFHKQCEKIVEKQRKFEQKKSPSDGYFV